MAVVASGAAVAAAAAIAANNARHVCGQPCSVGSIWISAFIATFFGVMFGLLMWDDIWDDFNEVKMRIVMGMLFCICVVMALSLPAAIVLWLCGYI